MCDLAPRHSTTGCNKEWEAKVIIVIIDTHSLTLIKRIGREEGQVSLPMTRSLTMSTFRHCWRHNMTSEKWECTIKLIQVQWEYHPPDGLVCFIDMIITSDHHYHDITNFAQHASFHKDQWETLDFRLKGRALIGLSWKWVAMFQEGERRRCGSE